MSNCMWTDEVIIFDNSDLDLRALRAECELVKDLSSPPKCEDDPRGYFLWWFVSTAVEWDDEAGEVSWHIGAGRSQHTFRDFASTIWTLSAFARRYTTLVIKVKDDEPGNRHLSECAWICHFMPHDQQRQLTDRQKDNLSWGYDLNRKPAVWEMNIDELQVEKQCTVRLSENGAGVEVRKGKDVWVLDGMYEVQQVLLSL